MAAQFWRGVVRYFALRPPEDRAYPASVASESEVTSGKEAVPVARPWMAQDSAWLVLVYLTQVLGIVAKRVYDDIGAGRDVHLSGASVLVAFIVSAVTFPTVYGNLQRQSSRAMRLFLAFQSGFFWQGVLANVTPGG
ncbi:MAG: hypothetical protein K6V36_15635 [Anaerolineae bacterium]|nr:hypothetical protein [Anaerolineae bacterium]